MLNKKIIGVAMAAALSGFAATSQAMPVAVELALLVDVSGSVNSSEYTLQKQGYVNAFQNATLQAGIAGLTGGIAVSYIEWSSSNQQAKLVDWTHITDATSSNAFAAAINSATRAFNGSTGIGSAITFGANEIIGNLFTGVRTVIDVSGDGTSNSGTTPSAARDAALLAGIDAINGLPIGSTSLENYYIANVQGGTGSFVELASSFADFNSAVIRKIGREIQVNPVPAPASIALLSLGLFGLGTLKRKKAN